jgi:hypothetical protein
MIDEHIEKLTITEEMVDPEHVERKPSVIFEKARKQLISEGHKCWICGSSEKLESHHFLCEWSEENLVDFNKLKELALIFDIYGKSKELINEPMTTVDDIRNQMILCKNHHTAKETGIHFTTFPFWIMQKVCKDGKDPILQKGETFEQLMEELK